mgnify:CR=1 FL=1|jgi:hypothetical protein|tara:strand:- start:1054 stop:1326 length:273 start_codon:yes stop_codon:yes gene_type:complete
MNKWRIIKINLGDGTTEYQVSDGDVGERTVSYDFDNKLDAENCLHDIEKRESDTEDDPHIACFSYPNCDEAPLGCIAVMGGDVEPYGNKD